MLSWTYVFSYNFVVCVNMTHINTVLIVDKSTFYHFSLLLVANVVVIFCQLFFPQTFTDSTLL